MPDSKRILLVEDDANDVELALMALKSIHLAHHVEVVHDGEEALNYLSRRGAYAARSGGNPAVVLLDLKLPKVSGNEVLREIRQEPFLKTIPVVILTSSREEQDLSETYLLGASAYVVKPVNFNEFMMAIKEIGLFWVIINQSPPGSI